MDTRTFEDNRWRHQDARWDARHEHARRMIIGKRVLDLGCGDGLFLSRILQDSINVVGLDLSEEAVRKCRLVGLDARVFNFSRAPLPFADDSFDTVTLLDILEHLYDPKTLLREAARVAKHAVVISLPNFNSLPARIQIALGKVPENNTPRKGHVYWFNRGNLLRIFADSGLTVREWHSITFWQKYPLAGPSIRLLARCFPSAFGLNFVIQVTK